MISNSAPKHPKTTREYTSNTDQADNSVKKEKRLGISNNLQQYQISGINS